MLNHPCANASDSARLLVTLSLPFKLQEAEGPHPLRVVGGALLRWLSWLPWALLSTSKHGFKECWIIFIIFGIHKENRYSWGINGCSSLPLEIPQLRESSFKIIQCNCLKEPFLTFSLLKSVVFFFTSCSPRVQAVHRSVFLSLQWTLSLSITRPSTLPFCTY